MSNREEINSSDFVSNYFDEDYLTKEHKTKKKKFKKDGSFPLKKMMKRKLEIKNIKKSIKRKHKKRCNLNALVNKKSELKISSIDDMDTEVLECNQMDLITEAEQIIEDNENINSDVIQCVEWTAVNYLQEINNIDKEIAKNIVKLLEEDNTVPFIARYRKEMIKSITSDELRALKDSYEETKIIKHRAATIIKTVNKMKKWTPEFHTLITSIKSLAELEQIYSLYKPTSKRLVADKAIDLGLKSISNAILHDGEIPLLTSLIDEQKEGLRNENEVIENIICLTAHFISKDNRIFDKIFSRKATSCIKIQMNLCKIQDTSDTENTTDLTSEYKQYFNVKINVENIKPRQILLIRRAQLQKIITLKIIIPDEFKERFEKYCLSLYRLKMRKMTSIQQYLLNESISYAYKKIINPLIKRRVRKDLKKRAQTIAIEIFAVKVKQLLLVPPLRGQVVLGINPNFHECNLAVVSEHGKFLKGEVIHPHKHFKYAVNTLEKLVTRYKCTIFALGNGIAYKETEEFLKKLKSEVFGSLKIRYTIVNQSAASIYSYSDEAKSEFPDLNPNLISAISIARRLQDPLVELLKIKTKHLGIGIYHYDFPEEKLSDTLNEVIKEVVSFVGVDVNTASQYLLRRIAGVTNSIAMNIINWRTKYGTFKNRKQLLNVKGIGSRTFEQCAGFLRILPETAVGNVEVARTNKESKELDDFNPLDQTWIHPELYAVANEFIKYCHCELDDLGTTKFIKKINFYAQEGCMKLAEQFDINESSMKIIIEALSMRKDEDIRSKLESPLFSIQSINDLNTGTLLNGIVRNITLFGIFIDIGVGVDGLVYITQMKNRVLDVGQRVEVEVVNFEPNFKQINLEIVRTL